MLGDERSVCHKAIAPASYKALLAGALYEVDGCTADGIQGIHCAQIQISYAWLPILGFPPVDTATVQQEQDGAALPGLTAEPLACISTFDKFLYPAPFSRLCMLYTLRASSSHVL